MHDLIGTTPSRRDALETPLLASVLQNLCSNLIKIQNAVLDDTLIAGRPVLEIQCDVWHLAQIEATSPAEMDIKWQALALIEEVLGDQSDCYRALSRALGLSAQSCGLVTGEIESIF